MELGKRLGVAFKLAGVRAPQVARATGIPVTSINALLRRGSERSGYTEKILAILPRDKVNYDWVRTGLGTPEPSASTGAAPTPVAPAALAQPHDKPASRMARAVTAGASSDAHASAPLRAWEHASQLPAEGGWVLIPKLGIVPSGPDAIKTLQLVDDVQAVRADWVREDGLKPAALVWSTASDASMTKVIYHGDMYVVDASNSTVIDGKTYCVWYSGAEHVRRIFKLPGGGLRIKPESDDFATLDLNAQDAKAVHIIGRVVHRAGKGGL